jgi:hypothetical protein
MPGDQRNPQSEDPESGLDRRKPRSSFVERIGRARGRRATDSYAFDSSEALVESMLGRRLIPGEEHALMTAARRWLAENGCPRESHAGDRGRYLVPPQLARRFPKECWPRIEHLAHDRRP